MLEVAERVDRLEAALERFTESVGIEFNKLYNSQMRTEAELRVFRDEMRAFKDEMRAFKDVTERDRREMNRKWGDLANKLGTMVEDLVAPSLPRLIEARFGAPVLDLSIRHKRRLSNGESREFDAIAQTDTLVFLNSTKASLRGTDVDRFIDDITAFRRFFPEHAERPLIGILATLAVDEGMLAYAARQGFLVLAVGDQVMEIQNAS